MTGEVLEHVLYLLQVTSFTNNFVLIFLAFLDYPYMIIEYVPHGDLLGYLRRSRGVSDCYYDDPDIKPTTKLTSEQMLKFAWQISDGMRYISSKKVLFFLQTTTDYFFQLFFSKRFFVS